MEGICQVSFMKVKDNTNRVLYATLNLGLIPTKFSKSIEKIMTQEPSDPDIIPVWDIADGKWKSFRLTKLVFFLTSDELVDDGSIGFNFMSSTASNIKKRRDESVEKFQERVDALKQQAQEAKQNINGKKPIDNTSATNTARNIINRLRREAEERRKNNEGKA